MQPIPELCDFECCPARPGSLSLPRKKTSALALAAILTPLRLVAAAVAVVAVEEPAATASPCAASGEALDRMWRQQEKQRQCCCWCCLRPLRPVATPRLHGRCSRRRRRRPGPRRDPRSRRCRTPRWPWERAPSVLRASPPHHHSKLRRTVLMVCKRASGRNQHLLVVEGRIAHLGPTSPW